LGQFYPTRDQLRDEGQFSGVRDKAALVDVCKIVFPTGRTFSSSKQVEQIVKLLLDKWGCKATVQGKSLQCAFSEAPKRKPKPDAAYKKQYDTSESTKQNHKCPFFLNYHYVQKEKVTPPILRHVKITSTNFNHTCVLCPDFVRLAKRVGGSCYNSDNQNIKMALVSLQYNTNISVRELRSYLQKGLPSWHGCDSHYISNL
jgi:hypothetical protein